MSTSLRPLHLVETWLPVSTGYTSRSAALVAAQDRSTDLAPRVLVTSRQSVQGSGAVQTQLDGVDFGERIRVLSPSPAERRRRRIQAFALDPARLTRETVTMIDEVGADLVHTHWSSAIGSAGLSAARQRGLPLVAEVRFDLAGAVTAQTARLRPERARSALEAGLRRHFERHLSQADAVVAAGESLARLLERSVPSLQGRVAVAANGCDPVRFAPGPPDADLLQHYGLRDRIVVGTTATMLRYEGLDLLLESAARLRSSHPELAILLVGDGPERARLEQQARHLGVDCVFTGKVSAEQVAAHYRLLDVMAIPRRDIAVTRYAGPLKLLEAMASGRACLATAVGDIPGLLAHGRGRLVASGAGDQFTQAFEDVLDDPDARAEMGRRSRQHSVESTTWAAAAQVHQEVYADLGERGLVCR
ncbi:MAG: glycosyltransferase family 4 protein [Ornithinimicrobium sp.]